MTDPTMEALIEAVETVPERRLSIFELTRQVVREDGSLDHDAVLLRMKELDLAIDEAKAYASSVSEAIWNLQRLL